MQGYHDAKDHHQQLTWHHNSSGNTDLLPVIQCKQFCDASEQACAIVCRGGERAYWPAKRGSRRLGSSRAYLTRAVAHGILQCRPVLLTALRTDTCPAPAPPPPHSAAARSYPPPPSC